MKRLISLLALLLLWPAFASANNELFITSGSMTLVPDEADFLASGAGFSTSGTISFLGAGPIGPGNFYDPQHSAVVFVSGDEPGGELGMALTVGGVPWDIPLGAPSGFAHVMSTAGPISITHAGTYSAQFVFNGIFDGLPAALIGPDPSMASCSPPTPCTDWQLQGHGTMVLDVLPNPQVPNTFYADRATFSFAPEPSTTSLLLLGFAGLAVMGRRRKSHAT